MNIEYRTKGFRIGAIHGMLPAERSREAQVRNYLYGAGLLVLPDTATTSVRIRLVGYEIPIFARGRSRDECIDLLGYDESFTPWIVELKQADSSEKLVEVVAQIDRYALAFVKGVRTPIQTEIRERYLWPTFTFSHGVKKMILAGRAFFKRQEWHANVRPDVLCCSFARYADEDSLLAYPRYEIRLKKENG